MVENDEIRIPREKLDEIAIKAGIMPMKLFEENEYIVYA